MQSVTYQWLLTRTLALPATSVGFAQMAAMLPSLLFLLIGGMTADRGDRRRMLGRFHVAQAVCRVARGAIVRLADFERLSPSRSRSAPCKRSRSPRARRSRTSSRAT
jgi:hypothetical protein